MHFSRFRETFELFYEQAEGEVSLQETSLSMMLNCYQTVSEIFTFEVSKYALEDFFRDFNEFIALYKVSYLRRSIICYNNQDAVLLVRLTFNYSFILMLFDQFEQTDLFLLNYVCSSMAYWKILCFLFDFCSYQ